MTRAILVTGAVAVVLSTALMAILWILGVWEDAFFLEALAKALSVIAILILAAFALGMLLGKTQSQSKPPAGRL
jgi:hypothetical protein